MTDVDATAAAQAHDQPYDVFVSYADEDRHWVQGYLLDAFDDAGVRYHDESAFALGVPRIKQFEEAVTRSRRVLLVVSAAYFASPYTAFVDLMAQTYGDTHRTWPVIPLRVDKVPLPPRLNMLVDLDATTKEERERALERLFEELKRPVPQPEAPPACPYPGMSPFSEDNSAQFFGRDAEVQELLQVVRDHRFVAVIGPSGSGKSSLVAAGLLPALRRSGLFGTGTWLVRRCRPGGTPMAALGVALENDANAPADAIPALLARHGCTRLLLFVDQLEELFTVAGDEGRAFEDALISLTAVPECRLVVTIRADFYAQLMSSRLWPAIQRRFEVVPLAGDSLRQAIQGPAQAVGVFVETALVERLVDDASDEPGLLPLVQETMVCLWENLERRLLPLSAYEALVLPRGASGGDEGSGLEVALARKADAAMAQLPEPKRLVAWRIFLRLVQFGEGRSDVRRQQTREALAGVAENDEELNEVVDHLASWRLLTMSAGPDGVARIDLAHEALITRWPAFRSWLSERREAGHIRTRLVAKADEWARLGRAAGGLLDEAELLEADRWLESPAAWELGIEHSLVDLVEASRTAIQAEHEEKEAARRREVEQANALAEEQRHRAEIEHDRAEDQARSARSLRRLVVALAAVMVVVVVAAGFAVVQRNRADQAARVAASRDLAARARTLATERPDLSLLLSQEALRKSDTVEARGGLLAAVSANPRLVRYLPGHTDRAGPAVFSPDGRVVASGGDDGRIILWDAGSGRPVMEEGFRGGHQSAVIAVAYSPDGVVLATGGGERDRAVVLWDARSGTMFGEPLRGHERGIRGLSFAPTGGLLASASNDQTVRIWDVQSHRQVATLRQGSQVNSVAFAPDGTRVVVGSEDGRIVVWDVPAGQQASELLGDEAQVRAMALAPGGDLLATAGADGAITLWDLPSRQRVGEPLRGHSERLFSLAFSPDGRMLASAGRDRTAVLWDVASRQPVGSPLRGHFDSIRSVAFAGDGYRLVTAGDDHAIAMWQWNVAQRLAAPVEGHDGPVTDVARSGDGRLLASADQSGVVVLRNAATGQPRGAPRRLDGIAQSLALSDDGELLVAGGDAGDIVVWNAARDEPLHSFSAGRPIRAVALRPDGKAVAAAGQGGTIQFWDPSTGQPLPGRRTGSDEIVTLAYSADGKTLAAGGSDGRLWTFAPDRGDPSRPRNCEAGTDQELCGRAVTSVQFSPDGRTLAVGSADDSVTLWDPSAEDAGEPTHRMHGHIRAVQAVAFSPDGTTLASVGADGAVILWDAETGARIGDPLDGQGGPVTAVAFADDDATLLSGGDNGSLLLWDFDMESLRGRACAIANRNLTVPEARLFLRSGDPPATCPDVPRSSPT